MREARNVFARFPSHLEIAFEYKMNFSQAARIRNSLDVITERPFLHSKTMIKNMRYIIPVILIVPKIVESQIVETLVIILLIYFKFLQENFLYKKACKKQHFLRWRSQAAAPAAE